VAPLFFLCFFAAIDAGLWAIQTSAAVSAAEQAARLAASAAGTPQSEDTPSPQVVFAAVRNQLGQAMFGTTAIASCPVAYRWSDRASMVSPRAVAC
jgi:Flp pilus assembly protein TadG